FVKTDESQQAGIVQKLSDQALRGDGGIAYRIITFKLCGASIWPRIFFPKADRHMSYYAGIVQSSQRSGSACT
ncbi:hypothetical protein, partial [Novacetimonas hansenii]|uniref:hypothetical protein n=1 Tax=Novacetimonas hansenii TaxID=436 RepID=UPI001E47DF17